MKARALMRGWSFAEEQRLHAYPAYRTHLMMVLLRAYAARRIDAHPVISFRAARA